MRRRIAGQFFGRRALRVLPSHANSPPPNGALPYDSGMLKKWLAKRGVYAIDEGAQAAHARGETIYTYKFHPRPMKGGQDLAKAISDVEDIGWTLLSQQAEGEGLTRFVSLVFRRREAPAGPTM